jgi:hypothetical protein
MLPLKSHFITCKGACMLTTQRAILVNASLPSTLLLAVSDEHSVNITGIITIGASRSSTNAKPT